MRYWVAASVWALSTASTGCGGTFYYYNVALAESRLETARSLGGERYAPYEYAYAEAHLRKAHQEAAQAEYGDANDCAATAAEYADKAVALTRNAHEGAGR